MIYGISVHSIIPLRKEPREQSEMVSQLLFGESYHIINENDQWIQVITQYDDYTGWIDRKFFKEIPESFYNQYNDQKQPVLSSLLMSVERKGTHPQLILAGSTLPGYHKKKNIIEIDNEVFNIRWTFGDFRTKGYHTINNTAGQFLNAPYLWGGRSVFGCDCSGFVQVIFKIHGIQLNRDSSQQAEQGEMVTSLGEAQLGDLAFFAGDTGKVYHVGLILSPGEIVHSSGYVHIDRLDETGIISSITGQYTHRLFSIRRFF